MTVRLLLFALLSITTRWVHAAEADELHLFKIEAGALNDSLRQFSLRTGLQVVYEQSWVTGKRARALDGSMRAGEALTRLLRGSGLRWNFVNEQTVAISRPRQRSSADAPTDSEPRLQPSVPGDDVVTLSDMEIRDQRWVGNEATSSTLGFSKPLLDTPRSVSLITQESIDSLGLSAVEDLLRIAPGVFTTTRFGIQGSVDVRNVSADTYFRGMKRVTLQGHGRSVLAAMDSIEIVRGPPSPIYGMGRVGGYTNTVPKSGRAKSGAYMLETNGFVQGIAGSYDRAEISAGFGGPLAFLDKQSGFYLYGLVENSDSYYRGVPVEQELLQAATSIDNLVGPFRLETGANYQVSGGAGALTGRFTQALIDQNKYVRGSALVNLDLNANGRIGYLELQSGSPVRGALAAGNQPLIQRWNWPIDNNGNPIQRVELFPRVAGIPQTLHEYLTTHPEADPTGKLRAQGIGGPLPISGAVPVGMPLDPRTTGFGTLNLHRAAAYERDLNAQFLTAFADLIYDLDADLTLKNQLFFDSIDQKKISDQPGCCADNTKVLEDKITLTKRLSSKPNWIAINSLASLNVRYVDSTTKANVGNDYGNHRTDAMADTWVDAKGGMTPNTTFATAFDNPYLYADGSPYGSHGRSTDLQVGFGVQFDMDIYSNTNLMVGARIDNSKATNVEYAGTFNGNVGTSANPGAFRSENDSASDQESGLSWSASLSHLIAGKVRPYVTYANSSLALDGNNNRYANNVLRSANGHIGEALLKEIGIKADLFEGKLFIATAVYEQYRSDVSANDDFAVLNADVTATRTRGWETELKWRPTKDVALSLYGLTQKTVYAPNTGGIILVDGRALGFTDVTDASGNVIYPAEAFLYGGRSFLVLPPNMREYEERQGSPNTQFGANLNYQLNKRFGLTLGGNYFSSTYSGRLKLTKLPEAYIFNAGAFVDLRRAHIQLDVANVFDRLWYRARSGDTLGDVLAQVMPDRKLQLTIKTTF